MDASEILSSCNPIQREAILHNHDLQGPLLILAGAGSGKTAVLTKRILWLVTQDHELPSSILALTFTAKAASEMRERVAHTLGACSAEIRLSTFHSLALFLLRERVEGILNWKRLGFAQAPMPREGALRHWESQVLRAGLPRGSLRREDLFAPSSCKGREVLQAPCFASGTVVFDDLIWLAIRLVEEHAAVREWVHRRWKTLLVDEYQDINPAQYRLVRAVLGNSPRLFVVGDDDQAIYGFRGADIGNILRFRKDYPGCRVLKLEWNYRSTASILQMANQIFSSKSPLLQKTLRPGSARQDPLFQACAPVECWQSAGPLEELDRLQGTCETLRARYGLSWKDFAILVRYNRQKEWYSYALRARGIEGVQIETIHGSKGLQYPVVFYGGLAEGITPGRVSGSRKAKQAQKDEERRLFYVGVTRAESRLYLLFCAHRHWQGAWQEFKLSRFVRPWVAQTESDISRRSVHVVFLWFVSVILRQALYMAIAMIQLTWMRVFRSSEASAWLERKLLLWARWSVHMMGYRLEVKGQSYAAQIDWNRPVFVVANHQSYGDIPAVLTTLDRRMGFLAKYELGRIPFLGYWIIQIGSLMVKRGKAGAGEEINKAIHRMTKAPNLVFFPEGTRSKDSRVLGTLKSGAFRMAMDHQAILLPIVLQGTRSGWEQRSLPWKRVTIHAEILPPIDCAHLQDKPADYSHKELMADVRNQFLDRIQRS